MLVYVSSPLIVGQLTGEQDSDFLQLCPRGAAQKAFEENVSAERTPSVVARFPPYSVLFVQKKKLLIFSLLGGHLFLLLLNKNFLKLS